MNVPQHVQEFGKKMAEYFGKYTAEQKRQIVRWAEKRSKRALTYVYRWCVHNCPTEYGHPPTVFTLNRAAEDVYNTYPELRADSHNRQEIDLRQLRITDDAGWTEEEMQEALDEFRSKFDDAVKARSFT